jgi:hypothetical protein
MFASNAEPKTLDVPNEPGQRVTIRRLGWGALRAAEEARQAREWAKAADWLNAQGTEWIGDTLQRHGGKSGVMAKVNADPMHVYDAATLIQRSVLAWDPPRAAPEDGPLQQWLAREILRLSNIRGAETASAG